MSALKTFTLYVSASGQPLGTTNQAPLTNSSTAGLSGNSGTLALSTSFQAIAVPSGAQLLTVTVTSWPSANDVTYAGASGDTGTNLGNTTWSLLHIPVKGGTQTNVYFKCASASNVPSVNYEFS
jgi:hypothetical protein